MPEILDAKKTQIFETTPIPRAVVSLAVPAIIGQAITIIYNLADTYFIGQLNDNSQVAAVTLCMPVFLALTSISNIFGVGAGSLLSQYLGVQNYKDVRKVSALSFWSGIVVSVLFSLSVYLFMTPILNFVGASPETWTHCVEYMTWTVLIGGPFTVLNPLMGYLVRSEGNAFQASFGIGLGGVLNILLDPLLIFVFHLGVRGAAMATCFSNIIAMVYFLCYFQINARRGSSFISLKPQKQMLDFGLLSEIVTIGLPSFFLSIMSTVSNMAVNRFMAPYGSAALAAIGVSKKINAMAFSISQGLGQGILPLIAYNHSSGNTKRMRGSLLFALLIGGFFSGLCVILFRLAPHFVISCFMKNEEAVALGGAFLKVICFAVPTTTITCLGITAFQAVGQKRQPFIVSVMRKGTIDVFFMTILTRTSLGMYGVVWATPLSEICTVSTILCMLYIFFFRKSRQPRNEAVKASS